jgi:hypothetical protein
VVQEGIDLMEDRDPDVITAQYEMDMKVAAALGWTEISHRSGYPPGQNGPQQVPFYSSDDGHAWHMLMALDDCQMVDVCAYRRDGQREVSIIVQFGKQAFIGRGPTLAWAACEAITKKVEATNV